MLLRIIKKKTPARAYYARAGVLKKAKKWLDTGLFGHYTVMVYHNWINTP